MVVDRGTLQGGFEAPVVVAGPIRQNVELHVALAASGTAYAVWSDPYGGPTTVSAAAPGQSFSHPRQLLPRRSELLALLQSSAGPVVAVWVNEMAPKLPPVLHYALLYPDGGLGRVVTVGRILVPPIGPHFALNEKGEFAVVGLTNNGASGLGPTRPVVVLCDAAERCSRPRAMQVGAIGATAMQVEDSLALSDDGTLTVFAMSVSDECRPHAKACGGLWTMVRRPDGRWLAAHELSASAGGFDLVATSDGPEAALTLFGHSGEEGSADWLGIEADGSRVTRPATPSGPPGYRGPQGNYEPQLAANTNGQFLLTWCTVAESEIKPGLVATPCNRLAAAVGRDDHLEAAQLISPNGEVGEGQDGIDGAGEAAVIWSDSAGVSIAVYHPSG